MGRLGPSDYFGKKIHLKHGSERQQMGLYEVVAVLISVLLFNEQGVMHRSASAFSNTERFH